MKKRTLCLALLIAMLCVTSVSADRFSEEEILDIYSGVVGRIAFSLPNMSIMLRDSDNEEVWTNSIQLAGHTLSGEEFQFRTADISPWIEGFRQRMPGKTEQECRTLALFNFAGFFIKTGDGEMTNLVAYHEDGAEIVTYDYSYPDAPGVAYQGKAILWQTTAVYLGGAVCDQLTQALERLTVVDEAQAQAFLQRPQDKRTIGILTAQFPNQATTAGDDKAQVAVCFAADFTYSGIKYENVSVQLPATEEETKRELVKIAERYTLPAYTGETVMEPVLSYPAKDMALLSFKTKSTYPYGEELGQSWLCRLYIGKQGFYLVDAADTKTGAAFMDSIAIAPAATQNKPRK